MTQRNPEGAARRHHDQVLRAVLLGLVLAACSMACGGPDPPPTWAVAFEHPEAALLSVHAADGQVLAVGADDGSGPVVLRLQDGASFERLPTGATGNLWWVAPDGPDGWLLTGEAGLVLHHPRNGFLFEPVAVPTDVTLYGVWVAPGGRAWAVGGDVQASTGRGVILTRPAGGPWEVDAAAPAQVLTDTVMFKVWGTDASDVWAVGEGGTVLRFDGQSWQGVETPAEARLLTVHGTATAGPYAVGGAGNGVLIERQGDVFVDRSPAFVPGLNGVFVVDDSTAFAVGNRGLIARRGADAWTVRESPPTDADLHAVAAPASDRAWAVGGALTSPAFDRGTILSFRRRAPGEAP